MQPRDQSPIIVDQHSNTATQNVGQRPVTDILPVNLLVPPRCLPPDSTTDFVGRHVDVTILSFCASTSDNVAYVRSMLFATASTRGSWSYFVKSQTADALLSNEEETSGFVKYAVRPRTVTCLTVCFAVPSLVHLTTCNSRDAAKTSSLNTTAECQIGWLDPDVKSGMHAKAVPSLWADAGR